MTDNHSEAFPFPVLLGDIGGTNARFCVVLAPTSKVENVVQIKTSEFPSFDDAFDHVVQEAGDCRPRSVILAIAAPVSGDAITLTTPCSSIARMS
ncbi:glucokinase [Agrobacterium sp. fls2-241-TYG-188a]|uniref:glucokinase n=1 Tax=Agrobacterium sp. fls2-241-TYG-188a TaxID=3040275 RepID=UPI0033058F86